MKDSIGIWQLWGFAVTAVGGTLLHFLYDWLGEAIWIAPFSGVNESTWEHMKLMFWPMLLFAVVQSRFFGHRGDFWRVKLRGILLGLGLIPIIFYTYNGVIGHSPDWINIAIFFISAAASYIYETKLFNTHRLQPRPPQGAIVTLALIALLFIVFTFAAPPLDIFKDPLARSSNVLSVSSFRNQIIMIYP